VARAGSAVASAQPPRAGRSTFGLGLWKNLLFRKGGPPNDERNRAGLFSYRDFYLMSVQVYGCNHVAIEVDDIGKAVKFYQDVFNLEKLDRGEGDAFFKLGEHQFLAIFEVEKVQPANMRHFGIMVRDEQQLAEVRKKLTGKYKLTLEPPFRCDFRDPWGNRIQVVDLHDESLIWLMPYREVQKTGIRFKES
jgi:catechol 2,3-dioxygenase-like lactoylglutathione lyase family enzyme